jgi:ketosteroid isomerase-like protein
MSARNKEIIRKVNAIFAEGKFEGFLSFCDEEVEWTIVGDKVVKGREAIRQLMQSMAEESSEPPRFFDVDVVIGEGDFVVSLGDMTMKDKDGRNVPYSYCDIYRFRGEKIAELRTFVAKTEAKHETSSSV